jgi:two-component system response regulator
MINPENIAEILLVEDLEEDATLCVRSLKSHNFANEIKWVEDGAEALDYLFAKGEYAHRNKSLIPKIILLDLKLPKLSGLEVLEQIRNNPLTNKIPVIVMTSSKEEKDVKKAYALGANSYIVKPVEFKNFSEVIKEIGYYWLVLNQNII